MSKRLVSGYFSSVPLAQLITSMMDNPDLVTDEEAAETDNNDQTAK